MSVALKPSPLHGKRFLEEDSQPQQEDILPLGDYNNPQKRVRSVVSPSGRCGTAQLRQNPAYIVGASTFAALRALFPSMSDKVSTVEYLKNNVKISIRKMGR